MKRHLEELLRQALSAAIADGALPLAALPPLTIETPADPRFGDLACNVAMVVARELGRPPRAIAELILGHLQDPAGWLAAREIAGPGFINFRFAPAFWQMILREALAAGESYGASTAGAGRRGPDRVAGAQPDPPP